MQADSAGVPDLIRGSAAPPAALNRLAEPLRGNIHVTSSMEMLQTGYLHAVAAAAGCTLSKPSPDALGSDYNIEHGSDQHITDTIAMVRVQLKSTWTVARDKVKPSASHFSFQLENKDLQKLNISPVIIARLLVVLLLPKDQSSWVEAQHDQLSLRHCAYWVNLEGVHPTGKEKTTVRVPLDHVFDDRALCAIMRTVGSGKKPQ